MVFAFLVLSSSVSAAITGCCKPNEGTGSCFTGEGSYPDQASFNEACIQLPGTMVPLVTTCAGIPDCTIGCCCAAANVPNSAQINDDEEQIKMTRNSCVAKSTPSATYNFRSLDKPTCVEVCGGTPPVGPGNTHTVRGSAYNLSSAGSKPLPGVNVFIPVPDGYISATTDAYGLFTLRDVPQINTRVFAIHPACRPGQSQAVLVDKNISGVRIDLNCQLQGCTHAKPTLSKPSVVRATDKVAFTITFNDACQDFIHFVPLRCDAQFKNCMPLPPQSSKEITDEGLAPETTYCYNVKAYFNDGTTTESGATGTGGSNCVKTGSRVCMELSEDAPVSWCGTVQGTPPAPSSQAVLSCDENNILKTMQSCAGKECAYLGPDRTPTCVEAADCDQCNGIYGFFARLGLTIKVGGLSKRCGTETPACYLESTRQASAAASAAPSPAKPLLIDAYTSCSQVTSCEGYGKRESCDANACGAADGSPTACEWKTINEELGKGVCMKRGEPACKLCATALGYCDAQACARISSDCYFDGAANGLADPLGCIPKSEMACRYYDTKNDCVGAGSNAVFDIVYTGDKRTGRTNVRTTASSDRFGIGSCTWVDARSQCVKNADMRFSTAQSEDDCIENIIFQEQQSCVRDSTPPTTTLYLRNPPIYTRPELRIIPIGVSDNYTPIDRIRTYVCFKNATNDCYPTETLASVSLPPEGTYELRYYSVDESMNIEPVKSKEIMIKDYHQAALDRIHIEENKD